MKELKTQRVLLMEKAWRTCWRSGELLRFEFSTSAGAVRARMSMYNAVHDAKLGKGEDIELIAAAQGIEICWDGADKKAFLMRKIADSDFIKGIEATLGESLGQQMDPVIEESLKKIQGVTDSRAIEFGLGGAPAFDDGRSVTDKYGARRK